MTHFSERQCKIKDPLGLLGWLEGGLSCTVTAAMPQVAVMPGFQYLTPLDSLYLYDFLDTPMRGLVSFCWRHGRDGGRRSLSGFEKLIRAMVVDMGDKGLSHFLNTLLVLTQSV